MPSKQHLSVPQVESPPDRDRMPDVHDFGSNSEFQEDLDTQVEEESTTILDLFSNSTDLSDPKNFGKAPKTYSGPELFEEPKQPDDEQLYKELHGRYFDKNNRDSKEINPRLRHGDDVAHNLGIDGERQGLFLPESRESYDSNRLNSIYLKNRDKKTDEVYLSRKFEKDKTFEKDAKKENNNLLDEDGKTKSNSFSKVRKLAVRSSKAIDEHAAKVTKMEAMAGGAAEASRDLRDKALDGIEEHLRDPGTESVEQREGALAQKAKAKKFAVQYETWKATHADLQTASKVSGDKADTAYTTSQWANKWDERSQSKGLKGQDLSDVIKTGQEKIRVSLEDRKLTKKYADAADTVQDEMVKDGLYDNGIMGKIKGGWRAVKGKVPTIVIGMLAGGMLERENRDLEGGRVQEFKWNFVPFKKLKESLEKFKKIREGQVMGGKLASTIYGGLMVLSEGILPPIRDILGSIAIWVSLISIFTGGTGLAVGAAAGGLALLVTMLKLAVDVGLTLWAGIMSNTHKDHDHRKEELASSETYQHGMDGLLGGITVGMNLGTGMSNTGEKLGSNKLMKNTIEDVQGNNTKTGYGSTGIKQGEVGWQQKVKLDGKTDTLGQKGNQSTDLMVKSGGKLMLKGGDTVNDKLIQRGGVQHRKNLARKEMVNRSNEEHQKLVEQREIDDQQSKEHHERKRQGIRQDELFPTTEKREEPTPELADQSMGKVDSRMDKLGNSFAGLTEKMEKAAKKADSKELEKAKVGDPSLGLKELAEVAPQLKGTIKS